MSSTKDFLDFIIDQIKDKDLVRFKKMFGSYALYYDNKVVALICNNQLFIKNLEASKNFVEKEIGKKNLHLAPPFPGAKDWILLEDEIEDREFLNELLEITRQSLK
jgi:TfoX/Sxy family transcriptional regulator of competence genes